MPCDVPHFQEKRNQIVSINFPFFRSGYFSIASFRATIHSGILIHSTHPHIISLSSHWKTGLRKLHSRHLIGSRQCHSPSLLSPYANRCVTAEQGKGRAELTYPHEDRGDTRLVSFILAQFFFTIIIIYHVGLRQALYRCENGTARQQENIF